MKPLFLLLFCVLSSHICFADSVYVKEAEDAIIEVGYLRKQVTDTTQRDKRFFLNDMILRIGPTKSLFCGLKRLWRDSISTVNYDMYETLLKAELEKDSNNAFFNLSGRGFSYLYKDMSHNEVIECDFFDMTHYKYNEPLKIPEWTIQDSVKSIIGLECVKATTEFKGRTWTAWFSPEIPISDGPWKLCGLAGLILEAHDGNYDYVFTAEYIHTAGIGQVGYMWYRPEEEYISLTRDEFFKNWRKTKLRNTSSRIKSMHGIKTSSPDIKRSLLYDREETDYPHE